VALTALSGGKPALFEVGIKLLKAVEFSRLEGIGIRCPKI
jgi:hypothetical protein